eukprot:1157327-Pelagomonas_calceolata.AAC.5
MRRFRPTMRAASLLSGCGSVGDEVTCDDAICCQVVARLAVPTSLLSGCGNTGNEVACDDAICCQIVARLAVPTRYYAIVLLSDCLGLCILLSGCGNAGGELAFDDAVCCLATAVLVVSLHLVMWSAVWLWQCWGLASCDDALRCYRALLLHYIKQQIYFPRISRKDLKALSERCFALLLAARCFGVALQNPMLMLWQQPLHVMISLLQHATCLELSQAQVQDHIGCLALEAKEAELPVLSTPLRASTTKQAGSSTP